MTTKESLSEKIYSSIETLKLSNVEFGQKSTSHIHQSDPCDCEDDDFWCEDLSSQSCSNEGLDKVSDLDREWQRRHDQFHTIGYRDGLMAGKETSAQEGFNIGFKQSVVLGYHWGLVRGVTSALASIPDSLKVKLVETSEKREKLQALYGTVHSLSTGDALKIFHDDILASGSEAHEKSPEENPYSLVMSDEIPSGNQLGKYFGELQSFLLESPAVEVKMELSQKIVG